MGRGGLRFLYLLQFPSYDVINDVIMSDADCTPGREPRSVAASFLLKISFCPSLGLRESKNASSYRISWRSVEPLPS